MIGETRVPKKVDEEGNEMVRRHALIFEYELILKIFGEDNSCLVGVSMCDWINEGTITFIWHQSSHYQSHASNSNEKF